MPNLNNEGTNLFNILINVAFGFVVGLVLFIGFAETIAYGSRLALEFMKITGYGQQMQMFGFASAAPYIVLAPIAALAVRQLTAVRSLKSFAWFAGAVVFGVGIAFFTQGYFTV